MQHGPDEMGPGPHDMGPGSDGENATESVEQPTEEGTTASPEQHGGTPEHGGENATMEIPTVGQTIPGGSPDQHGETPGHGGENATMEMPTVGQMGPEHHGATTAPGGDSATKPTGASIEGGKHGATVKLSCNKVRIYVFLLLFSGMHEILSFVKLRSQYVSMVFQKPDQNTHSRITFCVQILIEIQMFCQRLSINELKVATSITSFSPPPPPPPKKKRWMQEELISSLG